jgi:hypothetical protein
MEQVIVVKCLPHDPFSLVETKMLAMQKIDRRIDKIARSRIDVFLSAI